MTKPSQASYRIHDLDALAVPPLGREAVGPAAARNDYRTQVAAVNLDGAAVTALVVDEGTARTGCLVIVDRQGRRLAQVNVLNHGPDAASGRIRLTVDVIAEEEDRGNVRALVFANGHRREVVPLARTGTASVAIAQGSGRKPRKQREREVQVTTPSGCTNTISLPARPTS